MANDYWLNNVFIKYKRVLKFNKSTCTNFLLVMLNDAISFYI